MKTVIFLIVAATSGFLSFTGAMAQVVTVDLHIISGGAQAEAMDDNYDWDPQSDGEYYDWPDVTEGTHSKAVTAVATSNLGGGMGSAFHSILATLDLSGPVTLSLDSDYNSNCSAAGPALAQGSSGMMQEFKFTLTEVQEFVLDATLSGTGNSISLFSWSDGTEIFNISTAQYLTGTLPAGSYTLWAGGGTSSNCNYKSAAGAASAVASHLEYVFTLDSSYSYTIKDGAGATVNNRTLDLYAPSGSLPSAIENHLGTVTTNQSGIIDVPDTLFNGDPFRIATRIFSKPAAKRQSLLPFAYHMELDNARIDSTGAYSYQVVTPDEDVVELNHTTVIFDLVVSIEWDASVAYLDATAAGFRSMSNYLYDVFDGQVRLGEVQIYDDRLHWDEADIQVFASNMEWPRATPYGIHSATGHLLMPRRWFGNSDSCRNGTTLDVEKPIDFRTRAHELGHYLFGFRDEYLFQPAGATRCGSVTNYGFMDDQYPSTAPMTSELSASSPYSDTDCRNTNQWTTFNSSCWQVFENLFQGIPPGSVQLYASITTPEERTLPTGLTYVQGPNDSLDSLDINVGALVTVPQVHTAPVGVSRQVSVLGLLSGTAAAGTTVRLIKSGYQVVNQGDTSDSGTLTALDVEPGDQILAWGWVNTSAKSGERIWVNGESVAGAFGPDTLQVAQMSGSYPLIPRLGLTSGGMDVSLDLETQFPAPPTLDVRTPVGTTAGQVFGVSASTYTTSFSGDPGASGDLTYRGVDDQGNPFFVVNEYAVEDVTGLGSQATLDGPGGGLQLDFDPTGLTRVLTAVSDYPPIRNGLAPTALQAGPIYVLATEPAGGQITGSSLNLSYTESDLASAADPAAAAATLKVHRWDPVTREWKLVGGQALPQNELVSANIGAPGVYGLFTTAGGTSGADDGGTPPLRSQLLGNHPNPFNPRTTISFSLARAGHVRLSVFDISGRLVRTMLNEERASGLHRVDWDGRDESGRPVSSGLYFSRLEGPLVDMVGKMVLLK